MENYKGDLTDIVRASGGGQIGYNNSASASDIIINSSSSPSPSSSTCWEFFSSDPLSFCSSIDDDHRDININLFGDPFSNMSDPLLHELHHVPANSGFYNPPNMAVAAAAAANGNGNNLGHHHHHQRQQQLQISSSSSSLQTPTKLIISPCDRPPVMAAQPRGIKAHAMVASDTINANSSSKNCLLVVDSKPTGPGQISSPRNLGIKRR